MQLGAFWCFFAYYIRAPQTSSFACYMQPHSGPFLTLLAYHMGGFLRSVSSHRIWEPHQISFFSYYGGLLKLCLFFFMLYGDPLDHFFAYYIGTPRSLSLLTIWGPSDHFLLIQYGGPSQISFFACYRGGGGTPQILVSSQNIWGPPQISLSAYYMGPLRLVSLLTIWGPSDQFFCILCGGPSQLDHFFLLLYGAPSDQFLCILYGDPRSDQFLRLLYAWGPSEISLFAYYLRAPLRSVSSLTIWGPH